MLKYLEFKTYLLNDLKAHELDRLVYKIKEKFITAREQIKDYTLDENEVTAYTSFYGFSNYHKLSTVFKWFPKEILKEMSTSNLVDVGSGPGVFSLAWLDYFKENNKITMIEKSAIMQKQALKLISGYHPQAKTSFKLEVDREATMIFGHSFNEIGLADSLDIIKKVGPRFILLIEPGTKDVFNSVLELRTSLINQNYKIHFPCLKLAECPLAFQDRDWCHQFLNIKYDEAYESLTQHLKIDRKKLPILVHLYERQDHDINVLKNLARVIRVFKETKFSLDFDLCVGDEVFKFQVMKKAFSKAEQKELKKIKSGDLVTFEIDKKVKEQLIRGTLKAYLIE